MRARFYVDAPTIFVPTRKQESKKERERMSLSNILLLLLLRTAIKSTRSVNPTGDPVIREFPRSFCYFFNLSRRTRSCLSRCDNFASGTCKLYVSLYTFSYKTLDILGVIFYIIFLYNFSEFLYKFQNFSKFSFNFIVL